MNSFANNTVVQSFLLREKRKVFLSVDAAALNGSAVTLIPAVLADVGQLGFTLDGELCALLRKLDVAGLKAFHGRLVAILREAVGAQVKYRPLFKNFPHDVPDTFDYFVRRFMGYAESALGPILGGQYTALSCGHLVNHRLFDLEKFGACPICQHQVPEINVEQTNVVPLDELTPLKLLGLATEEHVFQAFDNVVRSRTSLSESYKGFVSAVIGLQADAVVRRLPDEMAFKETATFVTAGLLKQGVERAHLLRFLKTPTDVLRLAVALCGGDVSLKEVTRFKLNNGQRQFLMAAFNALKQADAYVLEEMLGYRGRWLRLGEVLHVGQFKARFPKAWACFDALRNREDDITTHASRVEKLLVHSNLYKQEARFALLETLAQRPGELARKLDALLSRGLPFEEVLGALRVESVSTTILLTLLAHFRQRAAKSEFRAFMPKGSVAKMYIVDGDGRKPLAAEARFAVLDLVDKELRRRFAERKALGKVFVDEALEAVLVPFSQRSASSGMSPMTRGSRVALESSKGIVRLFMHWAGPHIDVDLSCALYDEHWNKKDHLSWTNVRSYGRSAHSGDLRSGSGPEGACEFIDLDLAALKVQGVRYAAVTVFSYTGQSFDTFPCFAGFMEREDATKGANFEPKTVKHKFSVNGAMVIMVPMVVDLATCQVVWADLSLKGRNMYNTVESAGGRAVKQLKAVIAMQDQRVSLKELFELHGQARGELVSTREEADLVLDERKLNELDEVVADWL
ncbi:MULTISPECIES: RING finger family 4 domain-containing protein [unclassified Variovorax]|uniref:RING finger family 4 domain-containing protein n=1 Tax=unclassified Variovorax TaxID=663243 RepID=UPI00131755A8|nr:MULTISPECIES: RING finger family 4 domain-containing protein [unclassified Variovorax]VTU43050.1 hypothetical protein SRS16P1_00424 [Variovorax sp. SRS16]VTU43078.1 hypothetical protein E5P1_00421 [Variovorax sp. PBL-E5]VTU43489.1 hypothetical protein H6P1_00482 [Variovorax sp. PBL-H6]